MPARDPVARRAYNRKYQREVWYPRNRELHRSRTRSADKRRHTRVRALILELKRSPCADCGQRFPPECMDFDHVSGAKLDDVATMAGSCGPRRVLAEIAKCEIVCANCHRIRTARRRDVPAA